MSERFPREIWVRLLAVADEALQTPEEIRIIGGGAIALAYDPEYLTTDLDTTSSFSAALRDALRGAQRVVQKERELLRPPAVSTTSVSNVPYSYEDRFTEVNVGDLRHLRVLIADRHDLAVMKGTRALEKDLAALRGMHDREPFDLGTLLERYGELQFTGELRNVRRGLLLTVDRLFGERLARALEPVLERLDQRRGRVSSAEWHAAAAKLLREAQRPGPRRGDPNRGL